MKKFKKLIIIAAVALVLIVLFVPLKFRSNAGGAKEISSLTYRVVTWDKELANDVRYNETKWYFLGDVFRPINELWKDELSNEGLVDDDGLETFTARLKSFVNENGLTTVTVEPLEGEREADFASEITFIFNNLNDIRRFNGCYLEIVYQGELKDSIDVVYWELVGDYKDQKFNGRWTSKRDMESVKDTKLNVTVTRIYKDCFFVKARFDSDHYELKVDGSIGNDYCVGDSFILSCSGVWIDKDGSRGVAKMIDIHEEVAAKKPVIYFYPEKETKVKVKLDFDGKLTCTYPAYNDGWEVTAYPDGTLRDASGKIYSYLYWEGENENVWDMSRGFCVKGSDTAAFLETALEKLGLNRREANEFIIYWLPLMQDNPYNIISFQGNSYTDIAELTVDPDPDTLIRVFMAWQSSDTYVDIEPQELTAPKREGFTVVEWGGSQIE
jgi:hypothetical protein